MAKEKRSERVMVSRRLLVGLWSRFQEFCNYYVPRTSDTAMLEKAIGEFLDRYEEQAKKGEK